MKYPVLDIIIILLLLTLPFANKGFNVLPPKVERDKTAVLGSFVVGSRTDYSNFECPNKYVQYIVRRFGPTAEDLSGRSGVPISVILGVASHETNKEGKPSRTAEKAKNFFGLKAYHKTHLPDNAKFAPVGETSWRDVDGGKGYFKFNAAWDSFLYFVYFSSTGNYEECSKKGSKDYKGWLKCMKKKGYSTTKGWANHVIDKIEKNGLNKLDK